MRNNAFSCVERGHNLQRWTEMPQGGRFATPEEPELLAKGIAGFFGALRAKAG